MKNFNINSKQTQMWVVSVLFGVLRQWYLYEQIREHVTNPDKQDQYCSKPLIPKPSKDKSENI